MEGGHADEAVRRAVLYRGRGASTSRSYDVSADGKRFLLIKEEINRDQSTVPTSLVVVRNWREELKRLVPTDR